MYEDWIRRSALIRKMNSAAYHYRTNRWRWSLAFRRAASQAPIDRPVFLLGTQGGGLTIISRILRRIPITVSATGNSRYWAGYDEMQDVLYDWLPSEFRLNPLQLPGEQRETLPSWLYASSRSFDVYHRTAADASPELGVQLRQAIQGLIAMNAPRGLASSPRFIDKSQSFTIRIGLVSALLRDSGPRFVLISRDPFAMSWRAARRLQREPSGAARFSPQETVALAAEHWSNSMKSALDEADGAALSWWRFEDFLREPERILREICRFAELPFSARIMPGPADRIPWGSMWDAYDRSKWYPLRETANDSYLAEMPEWAAKTVVDRCGSLIERFGYARSEGHGQVASRS